MNIGALEIGSCVRPADGFAAGGDAVVARLCGEVALLAVIDVLGHGPGPHEVASRAESLLEETTLSDASSLLAMLDAALAASPGAAVGIATLHPTSGEGVFAGIGNTVARLFGRAERRLVSADGIVGRGRPSARPTPFSLGVGEQIVLHSDGITSRFTIAEYPQLPCEDPATAARELVRRFARSYDDAACLIARRTS